MSVEEEHISHGMRVEVRGEFVGASLCFHHVSLRAQTQVIRLGISCLPTKRSHPPLLTSSTQGHGSRPTFIVCVLGEHFRPKLASV